MNTLWIITILVAGIGMLAVGLLVSLHRLVKLGARLHTAEQQLRTLSSNLNALCSGAVGVDQRLVRLEKQQRDMLQQQESIVIQQRSDRPYGEAIHMVHKGANAINLVNELGLSRSEAELVAMLHAPDGVSSSTPIAS